MKITIVPHNTGEVREIKINNLLIILLFLLLIVPFIDRYRRGNEFLSPGKLSKNNEYMRGKLSHYQEEYKNLSKKCNNLLSTAKKYQSIVQVTPEASNERNIISVEELLANLSGSSRVSEEILLKLEEVPILASNTPSISPCVGYIIQTYGETDCIFTGERRFCQGIDFTAPEGSEVYTTANGRVKFAGFRRHSGLVVEVDHGYGFTTKYSHLSVVKSYKGKNVKRGEVIGFVGTTGKTTGAKLHYEVWKNEKAKDPLEFVLTEVKYF